MDDDAAQSGFGRLYGPWLETSIDLLPYTDTFRILDSGLLGRRLRA
jgi:hypothetical protein